MTGNLNEDAQLRALVTIARSWGVSPSRLSGRQLSSTTEYMYDRNGRLLRSTTTEEPEWTSEDRELAYQLQEYEAQLCPGCHSPMSETTDPSNEFNYKALAPVRCHRCTVSHTAGEKYQENPVPSALHIPIVLRGREQHETDLPTGE